MLSLVTAPVVEPLTLEQAKLAARIPHDEEDALIEGYIKAARHYAETATRRQLVTATWRLSLDCFSGWEITLPRPPLQSVTSITYLDSAGVTQTLSPSLYAVDTFSTPGRITPAYGQSWPTIRSQINAVNITFVAGYGLAAAVPGTIKTAMRMLVAHWYENREAIVVGTIVTNVPMAVESLLATEFIGTYV